MAKGDWKEAQKGWVSGRRQLDRMGIDLGRVDQSGDPISIAAELSAIGGTGISPLATRKKSGSLLHDFSSLAKLTVTGTGATITQVTSVDGRAAVRFQSATTGTAHLLIEIPIQNFSGQNEDGTDFDGFGILFYQPPTGTMTTMDLMAGSDAALVTNTHRSRSLSIYDGKFNNASPPAGGYNWMYVKKEHLTAGALDMTDPSKQMVIVRISLTQANTGYVDLMELWWNLPKPVNPVVMTFDDSYSSVYDIAFPYMKARGIPGTIYMCGAFAGTPGFLSLAQLHEMQDAGWTIANHTYDHLNASLYLTAAEVRTYMQNIVRNDRFLADNGFHKGRKHFAYPNGECTPGIHDVAIKESGKFLTARAINGAGRGVQHITGCNYPLTLPAYGVSSTTLLSDLTARLDNAGGTGATVAGGRTTITYIHSISYSAGTIYLNPDVFRGYIDEIAARISTGNFVAQTIDQWASYAGIE